MIALENQTDENHYGGISAIGTDSLYTKYVCSDNSDDGIRSLASTVTQNWALEAGSCLTLDTGSGLESESLRFTTVIHLAKRGHI